MDAVLDCTSTDSVFATVSTILGITREEMERILRSVGAIPPREEPAAFVVHKIFSQISPPTYPITSKWFHATRVLDPNRFLLEGIYPKRDIYPEILRTLTQLSQGMKSYGDYPNRLSAEGKAFHNEEGPFAFLFLSEAIDSHFVKSPELVEDLAGLMLGENYHELVERFRSVTRPCIVVFRAKAEEQAFESALYYAYLVSTGEDEKEAAREANTCFDGGGKRIPPTDVIEVQLLE